MTPTAFRPHVASKGDKDYMTDALYKTDKIMPQGKQ